MSSKSVSSSDEDAADCSFLVVVMVVHLFSKFKVSFWGAVRNRHGTPIRVRDIPLVYSGSYSEGVFVRSRRSLRTKCNSLDA